MHSDNFILFLMRLLNLTFIVLTILF